MGDLGRKFRMIDQQFKIRMNKNLEDLDLTIAQMNVLAYLSEHKGEKITQKKLSQIFNVKHSTMAGILQRMTEKGLIKITVDEDNKKYKNIVNTEKADKIKDETLKHRAQTESVLINGFDEKEIEVLSDMLGRIYHNLITDSDISEKDREIIERRFK